MNEYPSLVLSPVPKPILLPAPQIVGQWPFIWVLTHSLFLLRPDLEKSVYLQTLKYSVLLSLYSI